MSFHEYSMSRDIAAQDYPFYALIMAAMRKADANNAERLRKAFQPTWDELHARYNAPGGMLGTESEVWR
jgi:hypothetical protein